MDKGDWAKLVLQWEAECSDFEEDFSEYAMASLPVLGDLAIAPPRRDAAVYGLSSGNTIEAVCQANSTFLPGYTGKVLRIRHIVLSPRFDYSENIEIADYVKTLIGVFTGAVALAYQEMASEHIKFHLKSPAERAFGAAFTDALQGDTSFTEVAIKGSWIYLSKA